MGNDGYTIVLDMGRIETSIVNISQLGGLPCVVQSQEAVSVLGYQERMSDKPMLSCSHDRPERSQDISPCRNHFC